MAKKSPHVDVEPEVFKWLRESAGWTIGDVSKHLNVKTQLVSYWETGARQPTFNQIEGLAKAYKRPTAAFLLPKPPDELPPLRDFRRISDTSPRRLSKKTIIVIHKARYLQSTSSELALNLNESTKARITSASLLDKAEQKASEERAQTKVSIEEQQQWNKTESTEAFNKWRNYIEQRNICIFQFPMDIEELRGLSFTDVEPYTIVINSSDSLEARVFTLMHEYAHILLHEQGVCIPETPTIKPHEKEVEKWCNRFAGAFLMPKEEVEKDFYRLHITGYKRMASKYKVSRLAMLTRLVSLDLISQDAYNDERSRLPDKGSQHGGRGGGVTVAQRTLRERGAEFVSLVLENTDRGYITQTDALDYLNVKTRDLKELTTSM